MQGRIISGIGMYPYNTTLMGVLNGVSDYFEYNTSPDWLFGGSGHAFLINIHDELCPSGPYVWNYDNFYRLLENLGISMKDLGFYTDESTSKERRRIEQTLKENIDTGTPCSLLNMENQLITGYTDKHFIIEKPWPDFESQMTPESLTFQTWEELEEVHINFFNYTKTKKTDDETVFKESLLYALDLNQHPDKYRENQEYHIGLDAYDAWIKAVKNGYGSSHGNWWNGTIWMGCREMASKYLKRASTKYEGEISVKLGKLSEKYVEMAELLDRSRDKELADEEKIYALMTSKNIEETCLEDIEELINQL